MRIFEASFAPSGYARSVVFSMAINPPLLGSEDVLAFSDYLDDLEFKFLLAVLIPSAL